MLMDLKNSNANVKTDSLVNDVKLLLAHQNIVTITDYAQLKVTMALNTCNANVMKVLKVNDVKLTVAIALFVKTDTVMLGHVPVMKVISILRIFANKRAVSIPARY